MTGMALGWINLPPMPGVFPDYPAPVVRNGVDGRELVLMRWGMPPPPKDLLDVRAGDEPAALIALKRKQDGELAYMRYVHFGNSIICNVHYGLATKGCCRPKASKSRTEN